MSDSPDDPLDLAWGDRAPRAPEHGKVAERFGAPAKRLPGEPHPPASHPPQRHGQPGDPAGMPDDLRFQLQDLFEASMVKVRQFQETAQILLGVDQANRYEVTTEFGRPIFWANEQPRGFLGFLGRNLNPFYKNITDCVTTDGTISMKITFPWALIFRRAEVEAWDGKPMGRVFQRFDWFRSSFSVTTPGGAVIADIVGPWFRIFSWRDWVYEVRQNGRVIARIKKVWGGFFREAFSNADNFTIEYEPGLKDGRLRQLLVAAALTLDLAKFEQKNRGALDGGNIIGNLLD